MSSSEDVYKVAIFLAFITQIVVIIFVILSPVYVHEDLRFVRKLKNHDILTFGEDPKFRFKKWVNKSASESGIAEIGHNHVLSEITDLNTTTDLREGINLYYTEERVTTNAYVVTNTHKVSADGPVSTHSDVNVVDAEDNELLVYDISSGTWVNKHASEVGLVDVGHTHLLSEFTDINTTTELSEGSNLYYTEARVDANLSVAANTSKVSVDVSRLTVHSDVTTTSEVSLDLLAFSGGLWRDRSLSQMNISDINHTHLEMTRSLFEQTEKFDSIPFTSISQWHEITAPGLGSKTIPANSLEPRSRLEIRVAGEMTSLSTSENVKFRFMGIETGTFTFAGFDTAYEINISYTVYRDFINTSTFTVYASLVFTYDNGTPQMREYQTTVDTSIPQTLSFEYNRTSGFILDVTQFSLYQTNQSS
jgi:hypothetical protein